jgi:lambda family phage tail tape measure protein
MAIISRLAVLLGLDAGEFNAGLGKAKSQVESFGLSSKLSLAAIGTAFVASAQQAISFADKINDVSKANDMSVQSVLRMSQALSVSGGNTEDSAKLMAAFSNKVDEAATGSDKAQKAFKQIGVSIKDLQTLSPEQLFEKTVKSLANIEDTTKRNAMAMDMFGRSIRGVDIKGVADELEKNKDKFKGSELAFHSIGDSVDRLDRFFFNLKITLADRVAPAFEYVTQAMEDWQKRSQAIVDRFAEVKKEAGWWAAFKDKEGIQKYSAPSERNYGSVQGANVPGIMSGIGGTADKGGVQRQIALADSIKKANDALNQQIKTYDLETKTVGQVQSVAEKLKIEYIEGGKYFAASENLKKKAMDSAIESDKARQAFELQKMMEQSKYDEKKLMIQQQYAFASQAELQYQIDILDLEKRIADAKEKGLLVTKEAEDLYRNQEMDRINRKKNIEEEQHTFEYGWRKAYENYKRDAEDAAKNAGELFDTMAKGMEDALATFIRTGKLDFKSFANLVMDEIARIEARLIASKIMEMMGMGSGGGGLLGGLFKGIGSIFSGGGGASPAFGSTAFWGGHAGGGEIDSPSVVGENGPELFIPRSAGTIVPNNRMGSLTGGGPSVVYNGPYIANMNAIDTQSATQFLAKNKQAVWSANQSAQRSLPQSR